ncbi:RICIN domain-containing protein [Streptomyces sp. WMMC940]|uniref:RICIN domain-containing protein n=1 Tax=Streptomyces sp. WMMC940 TaxID=3015153 RepID=UPI0022B6A6BD|nr:RICIN domain-containing protein [Streptomyces sp. WMMC940]MCZ7462301.1 RICIN domain-containing protein [Streptomyces sp. WMMC940]
MKFHRRRSALAVGAAVTALMACTGTAQACPSAPTPAATAGGMDTRLQVKYGSKCLTIANGSLRNGAHVVEGTCDSTALHQVFTLRVGEASGWELVAAHSGRCLTYRPSGRVGVVQDWCNGSTAQRWTTQFLDGAEKNRLQLRPVDAPNECLSMGGTPAGQEPTAYVVACFDNLPSQEWRLAFIN